MSERTRNISQAVGGKSKKTSRKQSRKKTRSRSRSEPKDKTVRSRGPPKNPVNDKHWSSKYHRIRRQWAGLQAAQPKVKQQLFDILDETNVLILTADTGAGKTTQVPKLVWEYLDYFQTVICTQPRKLTAKNMAVRVAEEMDLKLGHRIGFRYRGSEKLEGGDIVGYGTLLYMTEGTFLSNLFKDPASLIDYGAIIIDEAHDRTLDTDFLLFYIRETLKMTGNRTKFIIMSATLDKESFMNYFKGFDPRHLHIGNSPYPVKSMFLSESIYDGVNGSTKAKIKASKMIELIVIDLLEKRDKISNKENAYHNKDILVFLPVIWWIEDLRDRLTQILTERKFKNFRVLDLSSHTPEEEKDLRTNPISGTTKIVISTNIAETGVTISGVYYVIDSGLSLAPDYDAVNRTQILDLNFISQSEVKQRKGRAGRTQEGVCFHLYTKDEYQNKFIVNKAPAIYRENYDRYLLSLFFQFRNQDNSYKMVKEVSQMLITPPKKEGFEATIKAFKKLGLLEDKFEKNRISELGECYNAMDLTTELSTAFFTAFGYEIEPEIISDLVAMLETSSTVGAWVFSGPEGLPEEFISKYRNDYGDMIALYQIYLDYQTGKIPQEYIDYLSTKNFEFVKEKSENLQMHPTISLGVVCDDTIKPKYKVKADMYHNLVSSFLQSFPDQIVKVKDLDLKNRPRKNNFLNNLEKEKEVLALSKMQKKIFGRPTSVTYDNFMRID